MKALTLETKLALVAFLTLSILAGCPQLPFLQPPAPQTPSTTKSVTRVVPMLEGRVDFGTRTTQATMGEVALSATVSLINAQTNVTVASTVSDATGRFKLTGIRNIDLNAPYFLEAVKGLSAGGTANRAGAPLARVRTLVYLPDSGSWTSLTAGGITLNRTTTALSILTNLHQAAGLPANPSVMVGAVSVGSADTTLSPTTPDTFQPSTSGIGNDEYHQVFALVDQALNADEDPVFAIAMDLGPPRAFARSDHAFSAESVTPANGSSGDTVSLFGNGFDPTPANNLVRFNGTLAKVLSVSADRTTLSVQVPRRTGISGSISVQIGKLVKIGPTWTQTGWGDTFGDANDLKALINAAASGSAVSLVGTSGNVDTTAADFAQGTLNGLAATASDPVDGDTGALTLGIKPLLVAQVYPDGHNQTAAAQGVYNWRPDLFNFELIPLSVFNTLTTVNDSFLATPILKSSNVAPATAAVSGTQVARTLKSYDIVYFGIADSYAGQDLTTNSASVTRSFAQLGKGVVFTHDTIGLHTNFQSLSDLHGLGTGGTTLWGSTVYQVGGINLASSVLTRPFNLSSVGTFNIQPSHSLSQYANLGASVWYCYDTTNPNGTPYWATYTTANSNAAFFSFGHTEAVPAQYEAQAMINSMYYTYDRGNTVTGTYTSRTFDSGVTGNPWAGTPFSWVASNSANTSVNFQVAATDDPITTNLTFVGPDGTTATYYSNPVGATLPAVSGRYLRYKAILSTNSILSAPLLSHVNINSAAAVTSVAVSPNSLTKWGSVSFSALTPGGSSVRIQILDASGAVLPDSALPGNSTGFSSSPIDLSAVSTVAYPALRLRGVLSAGSSTPQLTTWKILWTP